METFLQSGEPFGCFCAWFGYPLLKFWEDMIETDSWRHNKIARHRFFHPVVGLQWIIAKPTAFSWSRSAPTGHPGRSATSWRLNWEAMALRAPWISPSPNCQTSRSSPSLVEASFLMWMVTSEPSRMPRGWRSSTSTTRRSVVTWWP